MNNPCFPGPNPQEPRSTQTGRNQEDEMFRYTREAGVPGSYLVWLRDRLLGTVARWDVREHGVRGGKITVSQWTWETVDGKEGQGCKTRGDAALALHRARRADGPTRGGGTGTEAD